jgi:hypothetical protein
MIGADLESRAANWAASATSEDPAPARAVTEAYGDRLAAADVAGVLSASTPATPRSCSPTSKPWEGAGASPAPVRSGTHGGHWKIA